MVKEFQRNIDEFPSFSVLSEINIQNFSSTMVKEYQRNFDKFGSFLLVSEYPIENTHQPL
jgi:hypothetical protein